MDRQRKNTLEVCVGKPGMCEYNFLLVYLFIEAYLKPVAAARETAAFPATCLCFLIGLSSHPAAALYFKDIQRGPLPSFRY